MCPSSWSASSWLATTTPTCRCSRTSAPPWSPATGGQGCWGCLWGAAGGGTPWRGAGGQPVQAVNAWQHSPILAPLPPVLAPLPRAACLPARPLPTLPRPASLPCHPPVSCCSVCHSATVFSNSLMHCGTTVDAFLRENLDWLKKATNWAKFAATAGVGVGKG